MAEDNTAKAPPSHLPEDYDLAFGQYFAEPQTLGPRFQSVGARVEGEPLGQSNAIPSLLEGILGPYHAFVRAWETESRGERASPGDALEAALPGISIARRPSPGVNSETPAFRPSMDTPGMQDARVAGGQTDWWPEMSLPGNYLDNAAASPAGRRASFEVIDTTKALSADDVRGVASRLGISDDAIRIRETEGGSTYFTIQNPNGPNIRIRASDHIRTRASDGQPGNPRRNEIDGARLDTPEALEKELRTRLDSTKGRTPGSGHPLLERPEIRDAVTRLHSEGVSREQIAKRLTDVYDPEKRITAATVRNFLDNLDRLPRGPRFPDAFPTGLGSALTRTD